MSPLIYGGGGKWLDPATAPLADDWHSWQSDAEHWLSSTGELATAIKAAFASPAKADAYDNTPDDRWVKGSRAIRVRKGGTS